MKLLKFITLHYRNPQHDKMEVIEIPVSEIKKLVLEKEIVDTLAKLMFLKIRENKRKIMEELL